MSKKAVKKILSLLAYVGFIGLLGLVTVKLTRPKLGSNPIRTTVHSLKDSTLLGDGRQYGDVNLDMFIELVSRKPVSVFDPDRDTVRTGDSITFSTRTPFIFFGIDDGEWWKTKYKDLPVSFPDDHSFRAAVHTKDGVEYMLIPYQILSCLVNSFDDQ